MRRFARSKSSTARSSSDPPHRIGLGAYYRFGRTSFNITCLSLLPANGFRTSASALPGPSAMWSSGHESTLRSTEPGKQGRPT
jgi:hypothetical protein